MNFALIVSMVRLAIVLWPIVRDAVREAEAAIKGEKQGAVKNSAVLDGIEAAFDLTGAAPVGKTPAEVRALASKLIGQQVARANASGEFKTSTSGGPTA